MSISIREALEAIAIISAMIAVIAVPHPAKAGVEPKEIRQITITESLNSEAQYFPLSDVSDGFLQPRSSGTATHMFSRFN